jgi:hypothetical protein
MTETAESARRLGRRRRMHGQVSRSLTVIVLGVALVSAVVPPAVAGPQDAAARAIASAAGAPAGTLAPGRVTNAAGVSVTLGGSLADEVTIANGDVAVAVRQPAAVGRAAAHGTGVLVSPTNQAGMTAAAQLNSDGLQLLTVLEHAAAPSVVRYELQLPAGVELATQADGGLSIVAPGAAGEPDVVYGEIRAPWAVDATGRQLATSYSTAGSTLVQHVDHAGAAYPVVADPYVTLGNYIYVTFRKAEVRSILQRWNTNHDIANAACIAIPHAVARAVCAAGVVVHRTEAGRVFRAARSRNECARYVFSYPPSIFLRSIYVYNC